MTTPPMPRPRIRAYLAVSLDGFIARSDGSVDFLEAFDARAFGYDDFIAGIGSIVMGRKSFETVQSFGAWPYGTRPTYVVTRSPLPAVDAPVTRVDPDFAALATRLRAGSGGDVWLHSGARTLAGFADAGAVDRLEVFVVPRLIGEGLPLFAPARRDIALALIESAVLAKGVVKLVYAPG